ncbi:MAG TPA: DNA replication and repair protein RecF, partial [Alphaproteobacteria bacterium]|nr:DNA replication and repair protein RecF [Alphaproteobacteria bacterium]
VAAARRETLGQLQAALAEASDPFPRPSLAIVGEIEGWLDDMAAVDAEHRFAGLLRDSRLRDAESGHSAHGPHRSNLAARHLAHDMPAGECSTGEQKALLVSIILAEARLRVARSGAPPLLLLDEVAAHLDANRRGALAEALIGLGAQAWLTGTDAELFEHLGGRATFYTVADDSVSTREHLSA